ncbi:hypothetical protein PC116_g17891 [Phytophthora cactorum]|uniref:Uncharacterized protein n=1 Tax=Phytophthora cactorum TaxID=29920 RepID=A0A8T0YR01_9STRA|nr:hypothetical protein PC113_g14246 [Phytophthora cactorum]KAG4233917.1 hypothetical protein PC116_g17891 [Phytophthora cactorum]
MANWFSNFFFLSPIGARPSVKTETVVAVPRLLVRVRHVRLEGRETTVYEIEQLQGLNCAQRGTQPTKAVSEISCCFRALTPPPPTVKPLKCPHNIETSIKSRQY